MDKYWIWLQNSLKYGNNKVRTVRLLYNNIKDFYYAGETEWRLCGCFTNREIENLKNNTLSAAEKIVERCNNLKYSILTPDSEFYPKLLREIPNPPCVLYVRGDKKCLNSDFGISVVGTRSATQYGKEMAFDISKNLAQRGVIVVSGGAIGIDSEAHRGALNAGGKTIAVLGCGINYPYLLKNSELRKRISENGAVISEYPPDFPGSAYTFPMRNRIISGMTMGTLVIEAGEKSGSLITANLANEQNRDVFVVPVNKMSPVAEGALRLIQDGASVVTCAEDILDEYTGRNFSSLKVDKINSKKSDSTKHIEDLKEKHPNKNDIVSYEKKFTPEFMEKSFDLKNFPNSFEEINEYNAQENNLSVEDDNLQLNFGLEFMRGRTLLEEELYKDEIQNAQQNENKQPQDYSHGNIWQTYLEKAISQSNESKTPPKKTSFTQNLSVECEKIYNLLKKGEMHIDDISRECEISIKNLLPQLTELELLGLIKACTGGIYKINI